MSKSSEKTAADSEPDITELARLWSEGDEGSLERLIEATYPVLRSLARRQLSGAPGDVTLDTTALVHEAFLRFAPGGHDGHQWPSRAHFFAFCARVMRRTVIDFARRCQAEKRGGSWVRVPLDDDHVVQRQAAEVLAIEEALELLGRESERMVQIVECRFFAGLSIEETAEAVGTSPRTVVREWTRARAYLLRSIERDPGRPSP